MKFCCRNWGNIIDNEQVTEVNSLLQFTYGVFAKFGPNSLSLNAKSVSQFSAKVYQNAQKCIIISRFLTFLVSDLSECYKPRSCVVNSDSARKQIIQIALGVELGWCCPQNQMEAGRDVRAAFGDAWGNGLIGQKCRTQIPIQVVRVTQPMLGRTPQGHQNARTSQIVSVGALAGIRRCGSHSGLRTRRERNHPA